MLRTLATLGTSAALLISPFAMSANAAVTPTVTEVSTRGNGCPGNVTPYSIGADGSVTLTPSGYVARDGGNASFDENRRNCRILLTVQVPKGYTFTVSGVDFTGSKSLTSDSTASLNTLYYYAGEQTQTLTAHDLSGPGSEGWSTADVAPLGDTPCQTTTSVSIGTDLRVASDAATVNSLSLTSATIHLTAKEC